MAGIVLGFFSISIVIFQFTIFKNSFASSNKIITTHQISGLWIGTYNVNSMPAQGNLFYSFIIYPDGSIVTNGRGRLGQQLYYASGTWKISNKHEFSARISTFVTPFNHSPIAQIITGIYSNDGTITNAGWADINNPSGINLSGSFSTLQRVN